MTSVKSPVRAKPDAICVAAVDDARAAAVADAGAGQVGEHLGQVVEGERLVTHFFASTHPGYVGWRWAVTVTRASRAKVVTVDEVVMLPGDGAVVAPEWVPWSDRVQPGDLRPGDLYPTSPDDPRLTAGFTETGAPDEVRAVVDELGLGRARVLSPEGRESAAERWYGGDFGPGSALAQAAPYPCVSCGYWVRLADSLGQAFGVCANEMAPGDGRVVAYDFGCGAHSDVVVGVVEQAAGEHVFDTLAYDELEPLAPEPEPEPESVELESVELEPMASDASARPTSD